MGQAEARGEGAAPLPGVYDWQGALAALQGAAPPAKLCEAVAALGVQGRRLRLAVKAYEARVGRALRDPLEASLPTRLCQGWPEFAERAAARDAYLAAKREARELARAWAESLEADPDPGASASYPAGREGLWDDSGRAFALAVAAELEAKFPGPCSAIRTQLSGPAHKAGISLHDAKILVRKYLSSVSLRELSSCLYAVLTAPPARGEA